MLQAVFSRAQGPECIFLWRAIGAALVSIVPTAAYSLTVRHTLHESSLTSRASHTFAVAGMRNEHILACSGAAKEPNIFFV